MTPQREPFRVLEGEIRIPYKWTTGPVIGAALARLRDEGTMAATRCPACGKTWCPPLDVCPACHRDLEPGDVVAVGPEGTVRSWTRVEQATWAAPAAPPYVLAAVRLDGADTDLVHLVADRGLWDRMAAGLRVRLRFAAQRSGTIRDIEGFEGVRA